MGHRFRARDKTVKKMSRDGLVEKSLDSRETAAADSGEAGGRARLGRAGKADALSDSRNRRDTGEAEAGRKRRRGIRVKYPVRSAAVDTVTEPAAEEKQPALTKAGQGRPDSRSACIPSAYQDSFADNGDRTDSGQQSRERSGSHMAGRQERHSVSAESAVMIRRKENSREPESPCRDELHAGECREKAGGTLNTKDHRQFSDMPGNSRQNADGFRHTQGRHSQDGNNNKEPCLPAESENRSEPEYKASDDSAHKGRNPVTDSGISTHPFYMGSVRRQPSRGAGFVKASAAVEAVGGRKMKNPPDATGRKKRGRVYSHRGAGGQGDWKKQGQDAGAETGISTDEPEKEHDHLELPCGSGKENRGQQNFYRSRQDIISGKPSGNMGGRKTAGALSSAFSDGNKEGIRERQNKERRAGSQSSKPGSRESSKQGQDAQDLGNGKQPARIQSASGKQNRTGRKKKASRLSFDDEDNGMVCGRDMGIAKRAVFAAAVSSCAQSGSDGGQEQEDAAVQGIKRTARSASCRTARASVWRRRSASFMQRRQCMSDGSIRRESLKHGKLPESGGKQPGQHGGEKARQEKKAEKKAWQKRMIKKSYQAQANGKMAAAPPVPVPSTQPYILKEKQRIVKKIRKSSGIPAAVAVLVLLAVTVSAGMSSCGAALQGVSSSIIGTTYLSEDADIYAAEADYAALEDALDSQVNGMEAAHPGFDEYRYQVDEISHNPYHLISCLTAAFGGFTYDQVKDVLPELFAGQYRLTVEESVEMRMGTETDADTGEETEVEYEWRVLCIRLENRGIDGAAADFLTAEQAGRYAAYNATKGNRVYLFDAESIPSGGAAEDMQPDSGIPDEALSDEKFANMVREAEKYIGYPYVWGGSSPQSSFDCSGFVSWVINNCGNGWSVGRQTAEGLRGCCAYVPPADAQPGDLIFFQGTYSTPGASHVGIYVGNNRMIHCGNPVQYANTNTAYWQQHFLSFGRLP